MKNVFLETHGYDCRMIVTINEKPSTKRKELLTARQYRIERNYLHKTLDTEHQDITMDKNSLAELLKLCCRLKSKTAIVDNQKL